MDERYYNDVKLLEWASKAARSMNLISKFEPKFCEVTITDHKGILPEDVRHLVSVQYKNENSKAPVFASSSIGSLCACLTSNNNCQNRFHVDSSYNITTNVVSGTFYIEYLGYPVDEEGNMMILDNEVVKQAITNYCLWQHWLTKYLMKEEGAESRVQYFKQEWVTYKSMALSANNPDVPTLENIKQVWTRLVPRTNRYDSAFSNLSNQENVNF